MKRNDFINAADKMMQKDCGVSIFSYLSYECLEEAWREGKLPESMVDLAEDLKKMAEKPWRIKS